LSTKITSEKVTSKKIECPECAIQITSDCNIKSADEESSDEESSEAKKTAVDQWREVPFRNYDTFYDQLKKGKIFRITYNIASGDKSERTVVMTQFIGVKEVTAKKPADKSPIIRIKVIEDNRERQIYVGKISKIEEQNI
jgi:hypothetical protein